MLDAELVAHALLASPTLVATVLGHPPDRTSTDLLAEGEPRTPTGADTRPAPGPAGPPVQRQEGLQTAKAGRRHRPQGLETLTPLAAAAPPSTSQALSRASAASGRGANHLAGASTMSQGTPGPDQEPSYEQALELLDQKLRSLEDDKLSLEEALAAVDEARAYLRICERRLEEARRRIETRPEARGEEVA